MGWVLVKKTEENRVFSDSRTKDRVWEAFLLEEGKLTPLSEESIREKTVMELVNGPYILRMDLPTQGRVYFVGTDEPYLKLIGEGKTVRWLHDLFEGVRQDLIRKGLPANTSIYRWTVSQVWTHQATLETFQGATVTT
ncbi:MAG: hypothetical protein HYT77_02285 [Deltaproteobacteria bacterium]|nr:hypothetical protein [Deltaproteobacteria bacterium]